MAAVPIEPFGAGQLLQQERPNISQPVESPLPSLEKSSESGKILIPGNFKIRLSHIEIEGNHLFKTARLHRLVSRYEGHRVSFGEIKQMVSKITDFYRDHGYVLSRAILPKQTIRNGVLIIHVIEAKYGRVRLFNESRVSDRLLSSTLSDMSTGPVVNGNNLDRDMLLLSDIPGTHVSSSLSPGKTPGTTNLDISVLPSAMFSGNVSVDDYGDTYTGSLRLNGTGAVSNLFHHGDVLTVNGTTSFGGFAYGRVSYESVLNGYGSKLGMAYSGMDYRLGKGYSPIGYNANANSLSALGASGYAQTMSGWFFQPIIRRSEGDLSVRLGYDHDIVSDTFNQGSGAGNNRSLDVGSITLTGKRKDGILGGGVSDGNISYVPYYLSMGEGASPLTDPYSISTPGFRSVWRGMLERTQHLPGSENSLFLTGSGQIATGALDPVQQFVLGGPGSVRGYATAVLFGNEGYDATAEIRHLWKTSLLPGIFQNSAFFDAGGATYGTGFLNLMGPGIGETWSGPSGWLIKIDLSMPVGPIPSVVGSTSPVQAWFNIMKMF